MATYNVSSASELNDALSTASGGDTIRLASGDYGDLNLQNTNFSSNVTIVSADPAKMATFSSVVLTDSSNITFDSILLDYEYVDGQRVGYTPFRVTDCNNVTIKDSVFDGDFISGTGTTADGTGTGRALHIRGSDDVDVVGSEFFGWWKGIAIGDSTDVNLTGNDIHTIRSDGINIGRSSNVVIEENYIHDFGGAAGSGDHRDMIQFLRSQGEGSDNVTIKNNIFDVGDGDYTQTIFAGNDKANANNSDHWHTNIVVEGNIIYNNHTHGITFGLTEGLTITDNTLIAVPRDKTGGITIPKIISSSENKDVTIEGNVTSAVTGYNGQSDWNVGDNFLIQNTNPSAPGYYSDVFDIFATTNEDGYNQFGVKDGSALDKSGAGSPLADMFPMSYDKWVNDIPSSGGSTGDNSDNTNDQTDDTGGGSGDNTGGDGSNGGSTGGNTDDGNSGSDSSGDGSNSGSDNPIVVDDFVLDFAKLSESNFVGDAAVVNTTSGPAITMDGVGDFVKLGRLEEFEDSEQLAFTIDYARDEADGSSQRLVWNKGHFGLTIVDDGLIAHVKNEDGRFTSGFRVKDLGLNDTDAHQITVMVDQDTDHLQVVVDGNLVLDETGVDFDFVGGREHGWQLGFNQNRTVDGDIFGFAVDDDFAFVDGPVIDDPISVA